jgi:hypothetical protein
VTRAVHGEVGDKQDEIAARVAELVAAMPPIVEELETSRRLACDASRVVMRHDPDGRIVEVGARTGADTERAPWGQAWRWRAISRALALRQLVEPPSEPRLALEIALPRTSSPVLWVR